MSDVAPETAPKSPSSWPVWLAIAFGWALARAHGRASNPWLVSGYLGTSDAFDKAMGSFAVAYADQAERDHALLKAAVSAGKIEVHIEDDR